MRKNVVAVALLCAGTVGIGLLAGAGRAVVAPRSSERSGPANFQPTYFDRRPTNGSVVVLYGRAYRPRITVTRVIGGIPLEGQEVNTRVDVKVELLPLNGRLTLRDIPTPTLTMTQSDGSTRPPGRVIPLTFNPLQPSERRTSLVWTGPGDPSWADDVQLWADLFFPIGPRGVVFSTRDVPFDVIALP